MRLIQRELKYSGRAGCQERALPPRLHFSSAMDMGIRALSFLKVAFTYSVMFTLFFSIPLPACLLTSLKIPGIAKRIADAGYAVYAMDYPGFGLSYGLHGYIASFDGMVDHVIEQYARIRGFYWHIFCR